MQAPTLPPQLDTHPQHEIAKAVAVLLNNLLLMGRIDWLTAVFFCPSSAYHLLEIPMVEVPSFTVQETGQ